MRTFRPLFENYVHKDDVQQRRTLRSATLAYRQEPEDAFEEYLRRMSISGAYGGEPELVAFTQAYNRDVIVHQPRIGSVDRDSISYTNEHRESSTVEPPLHICYGGDEATRGHYDSTREALGSTPQSQNRPILKAQGIIRRPLTHHARLAKADNFVGKSRRYMRLRRLPTSQRLLRGKVRQARKRLVRGGGHDELWDLREYPHLGNSSILILSITFFNSSLSRIGVCRILKRIAIRWIFLSREGALRVRSREI